MDKASLLGDAIAYINELQSKLQAAEVQIKDLRGSRVDKSQESLTIARGSAPKDGLSTRPQGSANSTSVSRNTLGGVNQYKRTKETHGQSLELGPICK